MNRYARTLAVIAVSTALTAGTASAQEESQKVSGGGVLVPGWMGQIDAKEAASGQVLDNAKFVKMGDGFHVTTGPAVVYWNKSAHAKGDYTVSATFNEPKYMSINSHPHPYGIVIGGNGMGTDKQSYLYCAAYGNGSFIVRGFGPESFQLNGPPGEVNAAVNKAAAKGEPVTQQIAVSVKGDKVSCAINGKTVAEYDKSALVGAGKLSSTDGFYGIRFAHNTDAHVSDLKLVKH